ncbi:MAG: ABC transporter ATP-binding protein [Dehalococcoidia bacterium]|nr:ABC transporter ATP-binding protein [Dehalococcoidia bacterium]
MIAVAIRKRLGAFQLDVAFAAERETVVLFGRSGSGKSVTLAAIAGLLRPDAGRIAIGGRVVFDAAAGIDLPPQRRHVGYVVQQLALFPHLTAAENIAYGLVGMSREARRARVAELVALLSLQGLEARRPAALSGGQQQRVALARALARPVEALLLDEPFSALDEALRGDLRAELLRLQAEYELPIVFVTHDLREAHLLGDRVAVLDGGRVLQCADRDEVFRRPASRRVAELTGVRNLLDAAVEGDGGDRVVIAGLPFRAAFDRALHGPVDVAIRAERCNLRRVDPAGPLPENCYVANIVRRLAFGNTHTLHLEPVWAGPVLEVEVASRPYEVLGVAGRSRWVVELPAEDLRVMSREPAQ